MADGSEAQQTHLLIDCNEQNTLNKMSLESASQINHHHLQHKDIHYGKPYFAVLLAAFSSLGGWFFGYDQGVTGGKKKKRSEEMKIRTEK